MTNDEISLPPLPPSTLTMHSDADLMDYARAAVLADREQREKESAKPIVHRARVDLTTNGYAWTGAPHTHKRICVTAAICWTNDGRAWIDNERNRELAQWLRMWQPLGAMGNEAADALDGGVR